VLISDRVITSQICSHIIEWMCWTAGACLIWLL